MVTCVGKHCDDHVGAVGEFVHVEAVVALGARDRRLRRLDAVQLCVRPLLQRLRMGM